ncbi:LysR family transcriptional regulator [Caldimonas brevitalea]|uniref:Transcriptional regulator, LysR family n=1 Tax=Caldimonas brevitalea TaxID=413882 RepID=A0A0G3BBV2_9BURK|nr:LysR substrate-binding domain-containing protein [Caldimonas brevitalea]AKJ26762.1 transcriptional regulator, LysR family [Caldimonas brevitalea]
MPRPPAAATAANAAAAFDWDDLRYALAVADAGSLLGAARQLGVQHSTVLRRLDALERRLGARLFERHRSGYTTTDAGELMAEQARRVQPGIDDLQRRILGRDLRLSGSLRFNTSYIAMLYLLAAPLASFTRAHPGIEVEVTEGSAMVDLSRRDADVALRMSLEVPEHLVGRELGPVPLRVYARRGAPGLPRRPLPLAELLALPWIGFERDRATTVYERWMRRYVPDARVVLRVDLLHSMVAMLRTGLGVGLLPSFVARQEPELVAVSEALPDATTRLWLLTHADLRRTARVRAFMQHIGDAVAASLSAA